MDARNFEAPHRFRRFGAYIAPLRPAIATSLPEGAGSTQSKPAAPNLLDLRCSRRTQGCHATHTKCGYSPRPPRRSYPSAQPLVAAFISCLLAREGQPAAGGILYRRRQRATPSALSPAPALCAPSLTTRCHLRCAGSSRRATDMPSRAWTLSHPQPTRTTTAPIQAINSNTRNLPQAPEGGPGPPLGGGARGGIPGHPFRDAGGAFGRVVIPTAVSETGHHILAFDDHLGRCGKQK